MITAIIAIASAAVGGAATAFFKYLVDRQTTKTADWSNLAEAYSRQLADIQESNGRSYGALEARLVRVEQDLADERVRSEAHAERAEYHAARTEAAVAHLRVIRALFVELLPGVDLPPVPDLLSDDVK